MVMVAGGIFMFKFNQHQDMFHGDAMGYYAYLPATFIYNNVKDMNALPVDVDIKEGARIYLNNVKTASVKASLKHTVNQYTYGIALIELPFFTIAHLYEKAAGLPATGYSNTYNNIIVFGTLVYALLGLLLVYLTVRELYSHVIAFLTVVLIVLATHFFWFMFGQAGMSHIPLFFLYALLVYLTVRVHKRPKLLYFMTIGFVAGLITVIRPTDIVCLLIPLLYNVYNKETFNNKTTFIKSNLKPITWATLVFIIPIIPQLIYWQQTTGQLVFYSYGEQSFNWTSPKIIQGLFHFNNGWLPYAPVMIFALVGLLWYKQYRQWLVCLLVLLPVYIYIIYSWYCYNYINGLGSRPMIHMYPVLAIPLAAFLQYLSKKSIVVKTAFALLCVFFMASIFSLSMLMAQFKFRSEDANAQFYWGMLFKKNLSYKNLLEYDLAEFMPEENELTNLGTLATKDYNDSLSNHYVADPEGAGYVYHMWLGQEYNPEGIKLIYDKEKFKGARWLKCSGRFMYTTFENYAPRIFVLSFKDSNGEIIKWSGCKIENKVGFADSSCQHSEDEIMYLHEEKWLWGDVYFYTRIPKNIKDGDKVELDMWNMSGEDVFFDDFKIELFK